MLTSYRALQSQVYELAASRSVFIYTKRLSYQSSLLAATIVIIYHTWPGVITRLYTVNLIAVLIVDGLLSMNIPELLRGLR